MLFFLAAGRGVINLVTRIKYSMNRYLLKFWHSYHIAFYTVFFRARLRFISC